MICRSAGAIENYILIGYKYYAPLELSQRLSSRTKGDPSDSEHTKYITSADRQRLSIVFHRNTSSVEKKHIVRTSSHWDVWEIVSVICICFYQLLFIESNVPTELEKTPYLLGYLRNVPMEQKQSDKILSLTKLFHWIFLN